MVSTVKAGVQVALGQGVASTAALALADAAVRAMTLAKVQVAAAVLLAAGLVGTGVALLTTRDSAPPTALAVAPPPAPVSATAPPTEAVQPAPPPVARREPDYVSTLIRLARADRVLIVVRTEDGGPRELTFPFADDVQVRLDGLRPGHVEELRPGLRVALYLAPDRRTVTRIEAEGVSQKRQVLAVDADAGQILLQEETRGRWLPVAATAVVTVDGRRAALGDLPPGQALIRLSVDQRQVMAIQAGVREPEAPQRDGGRPRPER
jgi:hypothetical protein